MSVYKDKKRGTWYVSYSVKDPIQNKFLHKTKRGFKNQGEAKAWERENRSNSNVQTSTTFRDVAKIWENYLQSSEISRRHHKEHFEYRFGAYIDKPINQISKTDLIEWRNWLNNTDYATKTKNQTISYVKGVFRFANETFGIPNVGSILKSLKKTEDELMSETNIWTPEDFSKFIKFVEEPEYKVFFEFLFWTGCRRGEAIALQKKDVSNHTAIIKYSQRASVNGLHPTKTRQRRMIALDDKLWEHLQPLLILDGDYVFGGYVGLAPTTLDRIFKKAIAQSGVKQIRIHDLRHSHASWLINSGVNIVAVSKRLGHSNIDQTLRTYTHLLEFTDQHMMEKINKERETNYETKYSITIPFHTEQNIIIGNESNRFNRVLLLKNELQAHKFESHRSPHSIKKKPK